jgi:hypothetical protein
LDQAIAKAATALGRLVGTTGAGAAQPPQREQIEDWELLALSCRVWGDALFAQGQFLEATARYKQATVLAFAWQYLQRTGPDRYTWAFYGDVVARLLERLEAVRTQGPATARQLVEHLVPLRDIVRLGPKRKRPRTDWGCLSRGPAFRDMVLDEVFDVRDPATVSSPHHHSPGLLDAVDEVLEQLHRDAVQPSGQAGSP